MILATQSIKELEESGMLQIVAESCRTKIFLANPEMDRELYKEAFHLNDTELELIADLVPPGQMLRKTQSSKKVHLNVDSVSHWMATNNARDNLKEARLFREVRDRRRFTPSRSRLIVSAANVGWDQPIGVPRLGWHTFQHTFRSWLDAVGTAVGVQQKMMWHADVATTMNIYGKGMMDSKLDAHTKLLVLQVWGFVGLRPIRNRCKLLI